MELTEKYTSEAEKDKPANKDKLVLSNSEYAVIEAFSEIIKSIKKLKEKG